VEAWADAVGACRLDDGADEIWATKAPRTSTRNATTARSLSTWRRGTGRCSEASFGFVMAFSSEVVGGLGSPFTGDEAARRAM
jgi:hypothetical protein